MTLVKRSWVAADPDSEGATSVHDGTRVHEYPGFDVVELDADDVGTPIAEVPVMSHLQIVRDDSPRPVTRQAEEGALRPTSFDDYIGQSEIITNLRQSVRAAKRDRKSVV